MLTDNEYKAMKACLNYAMGEEDARENQKDDNFSNAGLTEWAEVLGWNLAQCKGLASSLTQKGFGNMDEDQLDIFWLSVEGIDALFDEGEKRGEA